MTMWFSPVSSRDKDSGKLVQKVFNITDVVSIICIKIVLLKSF